MAKVFVGIPTINRPEFVKYAISSVLKQSHSDIEVVVSDNCSDFGVSHSISEFITGLSDPRIRFYQQENNVGEYGQGRYFFSEAKDCPYFMILHDDDIIYDDYLEKALGYLNKHPECAYFVADADIIDENGNRTENVKRKFLKDHGRDRATSGEFSVLDKHLESGFTLISGTLFRTNALKNSGFVDAEGVGNYPFESDIFLRLGDLGAKGWYHKEALLAFRFHSASMRHYIKLLDNEKTVNAMIRIFERRHYTGYAERRRKEIMGRLYRAKALITVRQGNVHDCRKYIKKCFKYNIKSIKLWLLAPVALVAPWLICWFLPELPTTREAPLLRHQD